MRRYTLFGSFAVVLACVAGGSLECRPAASPTAEQAHGAELYGRMCAVCHGPHGEGYRADQATALMHPHFLASASDDLLRTAIANGRTGTTMSAWSVGRGGPLSPADVSSLVAFLHTWERHARAALDESPLSGDATRGATTYARECQRCHGDRGLGGPNVSIGNRELLATASNGFLRYAVRNGRPGTAMPAFDDSLGDSGIEDVVALMRSWASPAPLAQQQPAARPPPLPLGPVPLNPKGPEPVGFKATPSTTSTDLVHAELARGARMALLDARAPSDYTYEHIAGGVSVPFYDPDPYVAALPKDAWLVCYCSCPHAESGMLAQKLVAKGFTKVTVLDEGLNVWRNKGYGTHKGTDP